MMFTHAFKHYPKPSKKSGLLFKSWLRFATTGCTTFDHTQDTLTTEIKHEIERHWKNKLTLNEFDVNQPDNKYYVLPMFPYPSGDLHMGHVRVYAISDAMTRYFRLNGKNVLHPMGWDAFGLPAENAAMERNISSEEWTQQNVASMKEQLDLLGCSFDWKCELSTCDPSYYKWTQWLFLRLFREGLAYQQEAIVNWDPVDKTVLAHEQVDENGYAWRSGAKVEKKLLKQWFIRTSRHSQALLKGLDDIHREDWQDVIKIQKHWIGDCDGWNFSLDLCYASTTTDKIQLKNLDVWTKNPEELQTAAFIAVKSEHLLNHTNNDVKLLEVVIKNPFKEGTLLPIIVCDEFDYPTKCDTYVGVPSVREMDKHIADRLQLKYDKTLPVLEDRDRVIQKARQLRIGGDLVSSKHQNWLISRQRFWGTPIPIIHCQTCGSVPVQETDLPVVLPSSNVDENGQRLTLKDMVEWKHVECPKCGDKNAERETDTMDTFMDSSWYYLRFIDSKNSDAIFDKELASKLVPVDLYIGGKEHAVLHLYYARFVQHFLHDLGLVPEKEPFRRLIPQGMVLGQTYQVKESGKYLRPEEVTIINEKKNQATETATGKPVKMEWLKMSKSKKNGVVPVDLINEYGIDTIRLIMLTTVAPKTPRQWSNKDGTFTGVMRWQSRLWEIVADFNKIRQDNNIALICPDTQAEFDKNEMELFNARNYWTACMKHSFQNHFLNLAFQGPQSLTKTIGKMPKNIVKFSRQYELTLANIIICMAPCVPHFTSEVWSKFISVPNRVDQDDLILWSKDVLEQKWPELDSDYKAEFNITINSKTVHTIRYPLDKITEMTKKDAVDYAFKLRDVEKYAHGRGTPQIEFKNRGARGVLLDIDFDVKLKKKKKQQNVTDEDSDST